MLLLKSMRALLRSRKSDIAPTDPIRKTHKPDEHDHMFAIFLFSVFVFALCSIINENYTCDDVTHCAGFGVFSRQPFGNIEHLI